MKNHAPAFLISALVHLGLLALVLAGVAQLPSDTPEETRLAVSLQMFQAPPAPEAEPEPDPLPEPEPIPEPIPEPEPEPEPIIEAEPEPAPEPVKVEPPRKPKPEPNTEPKPKPTKPKQIKPVTPPPPPMEQAPVTLQPAMSAVDAGQVHRLEEEYKAALTQAIETNKRYPRRAVRLRQEGEVVVGFTVLRNGVIEQLRVVESSGSGLLDKAASTAVEKISGQLPFPDELERNEWDFTVPINYALR